MRQTHDTYFTKWLTAGARWLLIGLPIAFTLSHAQPPTLPSATVRILEAYPGPVEARLEARDRFARALPAAPQGLAPNYVLQSLSLWRPGQTIRVAFAGGSSALYVEIADAASVWLAYGNVKFDFGLNPTTGHYREWTTADTVYAAEIRISFDQAGYWSFVGQDSVDASITRPNQPSMNFQRFDIYRPDDWKTVVIHEFGHALGFLHEHQNPIGGCDADFRWYDDPGYVPTTVQTNLGPEYFPDSAGHRPGLYTSLGGAPNIWDKSKVDANLRQLSNSSAYVGSQFDRSSIMKYFFDPSMFVQGEKSHCYSPENLALSAGDQAGIRRFYPSDAGTITQLLRSRQALFSDALKLQQLDPATLQRYTEQFHLLQNIH